MSTTTKMPRTRQRSHRLGLLGLTTIFSLVLSLVGFVSVSASDPASVLPDARAYELVSTAGNFGEPYEPTSPEYGIAPHSEYPFQSAADGDAVTYVGEAAATGGTGNQGSGEGNQWMATRNATGWQTTLISPSAAGSLGASFPVFQSFSSDLATAVIVSETQPPLAPGAPVGCHVLYARDNASGAYGALFTSTQTPENCGHPLYAGASDNDAQVIFQSEAALTPGSSEVTEVPAGDANGHSGATGVENGSSCSFGCNLYLESGAHLTLVNVLPGSAGTSSGSASFGGYTAANSSEPDFSQAISSDGSRVFWTDTQAGPDMERVFVLENGVDEVQVSGADPAQYWTASPDGRYAFYTEDGALWQFDTVTGARTEIAGRGIQGEPAAVVGVIGANTTGEDASYIYLVAENRLAANANENGEVAAVGSPNLYERHEGHMTFIATLSVTDDFLGTTIGGAGEHGDWAFNLGSRTAQITPDGHHLVFESIRPITGYENLTPESSRLTEVFVYDAASTQLACASCSPSGAPPELNLPGSETDLPISSQSRITLRRWISEDGRRVFFDTRQPLVSQDGNGSVQDVYEWEAEGDGTCTPQTPARRNHGCVFLLSGGNSTDLSFLVDADATGENVFFEHRGQLGATDVPSDQNELYDARVNGGFSQTSLACSGAGCQGVPPAPPAFATPASVTFGGIGNFPPAKSTKVVSKSLTRAQKLAAALKACGKERRRGRRTSCQTRARKRYGVKSKTAERTAGNERRAKS
jgi:hypothetical protein